MPSCEPAAYLSKAAARLSPCPSKVKTTMQPTGGQHRTTSFTAGADNRHVEGGRESPNIQQLQTQHGAISLDAQKPYRSTPTFEVLLPDVVAHLRPGSLETSAPENQSCQLCGPSRHERKTFPSARQTTKPRRSLHHYFTIDYCSTATAIHPCMPFSRQYKLSMRSVRLSLVLQKKIFRPQKQKRIPFTQQCMHAQRVRICPREFSTS